MGLLQDILTKAIQSGASDTHLVAGMPPLYRIHKELDPTDGFAPLTGEQTMQFVREMVPESRLREFEEKRDLDFSTSIEGMGRFRVNAHYQRETVALAFRAISNDIPELSKLNLPEVVESFVHLPRGLVLVTGQTGSGKSTTLASMIDAMNAQYNHHIITLEDPIEYEFTSKRCVVEQRELGSDCPDFASGLKHALRQDPDIILVGEMRDLETVSAAITAAETGHLVLSTLHTQNAAQTIERIIDVYPGEQQNQIRSMLSNTLQAVISMSLFRRADQVGMAPACEIMICNPAIRNCIRENRIHEIANIIVTNKKSGMMLFDEALRDLCRKGMITREQAIEGANRPEQLARMLGM